MRRMISISDDDAIALLDYLDNAESDFFEYGASDEEYRELSAVRQRLHMAIYGAPGVPTVRRPTPPDLRVSALAPWSDALRPIRAPILTMLAPSDPPTTKTIVWGFANSEKEKRRAQGVD